MASRSSICAPDFMYTGSVLHGGGANVSDGDRIALNIDYVNAWLRQEENQYMSCPMELVKEFSPELRALLGYTMANYGLGYYSPPTFTPGIPDTLPPELAFVDAPEDASTTDALKGLADFPETKTF